MAKVGSEALNALARKNKSADCADDADEQNTKTPTADSNMCHLRNLRIITSRHGPPALTSPAPNSVSTAFDNLIGEWGTRWSHAAFGVAPYSHVRVMLLLAGTGGSHGIERQ